MEKKMLDLEDLDGVTGGSQVERTGATDQVLELTIKQAKKRGYTLDKFLDEFKFRGTDKEAFIRAHW